jgi:hypothetical protein
MFGLYLGMQVLQAILWDLTQTNDGYINYTGIGITDYVITK